MPPGYQLRLLAEAEQRAYQEEIEWIVAEQRKYAALGPLGRWRWRRTRFGTPVGWRGMSSSSRRKRRREGRG